MAKNKPRTLTPKQEAFCLAYIETMNASEAYRRVYNAANMADATVHRKAKELLDNGKITARLQELRAPAVAHARLTLEQHLEELRRLRDRAESSEKYGPAIQAEIARGKAAGLYSDKIELTGKDGARLEVAAVSVPPPEMTDEERIARISEIFRLAQARRDAGEQPAEGDQ